MPLGVQGYSRVIHFLFPFSEIFIPCHHCVELSSFGFCKDSLLVPSSVAFVNWFGLAKPSFFCSWFPTSLCSLESVFLSILFLILPVLFFGDAIYFSSRSLYVLLSSIEFTGSFSSHVLICLNRLLTIMKAFCVLLQSWLFPRSYPNLPRLVVCWWPLYPLLLKVLQLFFLGMDNLAPSLWRSE